MTTQLSFFVKNPRANERENFFFCKGLDGSDSKIDLRNGVPYVVNEFWTAKQRQSHSLHEVSYRACFKAQLPEFFIDSLTKPGDVVYDPFMGRGTTLLQAAVMGRKAVGNDINPLSVFLCRPRLNTPTLAEVAERLAEIDWERSVEVEDELSVFYHPDTLREITILKNYLAVKMHSDGIDSVDDWIRMVAINRLSGHSPGFFSVYSLPPNQAVSIERQRKINEKRDQIPPRRSVPELIKRKTKALLKDGLLQSEARFNTGPASSTPEIKSGSVDLVVTSPPFLDIVQYSQDNWLRCWFAGIDSSAVPISMHRKPEDWSNFVREVFVELCRVVRPGGHIAFEVGEVRRGTINLDELVIDATVGLPVAPVAVIVNTQEFTKTANVWGVNNNSAGTNSNRIVLFRRS